MQRLYVLFAFSMNGDYKIPLELEPEREYQFRICFPNVNWKLIGMRTNMEEPVWGQR